MSTNKRFNIATISKIGILSAISIILMFAEIPMFGAPWLKMDFADVPALIGGFALGPLAGVLIEVIKVAVSFFAKNSGTGGVGEFANLLLGIALVLPACLIYRKNKKKSRAIIGLAVGSVLMVILAPILNYYVLIPLFMGMAPAMFEGFDMRLYLIGGAIPVTAIKAVAESLLVVLLYKPLSGILHKQSYIHRSKADAESNEKG